jgi:hypothetical protein
MWWLDIFLAGITRLIDIRWGENTQTCSNMVCRCELGIDVWKMYALPVHFKCIIGEKSGLYGNKSRNTIYIYLSNEKFISMFVKLLTHAFISCPSYVFNSCDSIIVALFRLIAPHSGFEYEELFMASVKIHLVVINDNACCSNIVWGHMLINFSLLK